MWSRSHCHWFKEWDKIAHWSVSTAGTVSSHCCEKRSWTPISKVLHSVAYLCSYTKKNTALVAPGGSVFMLCWYSFLCYSVVMWWKIRKSASQRAQNLVRQVVSPSLDSSSMACITYTCLPSYIGAPSWTQSAFATQMTHLSSHKLPMEVTIYWSFTWKEHAWVV